MKTKSGKSHFVCEFRTYDAAGKLKYRNTEFKFTSSSAKDFIDRTTRRYAAHGYTVKFTNVVNLDEEVGK